MDTDQFGTLKVGEKEGLKYYIKRIKGWKKIKWKSTNKKVATIKKLKVIGNGKGTCWVYGKKSGITYKIFVKVKGKENGGSDSGSTSKPSLAGLDKYMKKMMKNEVYPGAKKVIVKRKGVYNNDGIRNWYKYAVTPVYNGVQPVTYYYQGSWIGSSYVFGPLD